MKGSTDRVLECTTGQFDGTIALISPTASWVVRASPLPHFCQADSSCRPSGKGMVRYTSPARVPRAVGFW